MNQKSSLPEVPQLVSQVLTGNTEARFKSNRALAVCLLGAAQSAYRYPVLISRA
jgi:hypothetical protein